MNVNKVFLVGRLTSDPELVTPKEKTPYTRTCLAINRKGKDAGADFVNVVCFGKTAEAVAKYMKKGSELCVCGSIRVDTYKDEAGKNRNAVSVFADSVEFGAKQKESSVSEEPNLPY